MRSDFTNTDDDQNNNDFSLSTVFSQLKLRLYAATMRAKGWTAVEVTKEDERFSGDPLDATTTKSHDNAPAPRTEDAGNTIEMLRSPGAAAAGGGGGGERRGEQTPGTDRPSIEPGSTIEYRVYRRRWFGLVQLTLLNIIVSWDWLTYAPVASDAALFFQTDESTINWLSTAFMFAFVAVTPVVIYTLHWGPKPAIVTSAILIFLGNWIRYAGTVSGLGWEPNSDGKGGQHRVGGHFGVVMFGQILTGVAQPFVLAAPARYSDLWFTNRGRVAATALMSLANPFGAALGQLIVPFWVNRTADVPNMVLWVSILSTAASVPSFFVYAKPPTPVAPSGEEPKTDLWASVKTLAGSLEFWLLFVPFTVYVGFFNSISTLLTQIMSPYGYSDDEAGIGGALLIVVGLVCAAVTSPVLDRTKAFITATKVCVPIIALSYLVFIWMPETHDQAGLAGPYVILSILGAASFTLVPIAVELLVELTHPVSPEVTSTFAWSGGQLLGGVFIIISNALRTSDDGPDRYGPPHNMKRALIFTAVVALATMPIPLCLGLFGRREAVRLRRVQADAAELERRQGF